MREFSPLVAGLLVLPSAVAQMIFAPLSPTLVRRAGPRAVAAGGIVAVCCSFAFFAMIQQDTPVPAVLVFFFVQAGAMATVLTPATDAIVSSVPPGKAGAASAVQNTARQIATAMGVAVLGAVISFHYRSAISPVLTQVAEEEGVPEDRARPAGESIEATMTLARELGESGRALVAPAKEAFVSGMHLAALVSLTFGLVGLVVVLVWLPRTSDRHGSAGDRGSGTRTGRSGPHASGTGA